MKVDGNIYATVQTKSTASHNAIGEAIETWTDLTDVWGWLDFMSGQADVQQYNAKIQDSTHVFLCDADRWPQGATTENCRLKVKNEIYNVLLIDNPMELNYHLEIFLQYVGGGLGVN